MEAFPTKKQLIKNSKTTYQNDYRQNDSSIMNKYLHKLESRTGFEEFFRDADGNWRLKPIKKRHGKSKF